MWPEVVFDNFACDSNVCNDCPPLRTEVLKSIATCSQLLNEIWRINGENNEFQREINEIILKIINNISKLGNELML